MGLNAICTKHFATGRVAPLLQLSEGAIGHNLTSKHVHARQSPLYIDIGALS